MRGVFCYDARVGMGFDGLIASLEAKGVLRTPVIRDALKKVDRKKFVPDVYAASAYEDIPLPIGEGQTISQPYTVVYMLELLQPRSGQQILDIGSGSGWQTALLAEMVGSRGKIYAIEIVPYLCELGRSHLAQYPKLQSRVSSYCQSAAPGLPEVARKIGGFDALIAAAEVEEVPRAWRVQLKAGGRLVYPKSGALFVETKHKDGTFRVEHHPGFAFVPFVESPHRSAPPREK